MEEEVEVAVVLQGCIDAPWRHAEVWRAEGGGRDDEEGLDREPDRDVLERGADPYNKGMLWLRKEW